jgi:hypothetical protein
VLYEELFDLGGGEGVEGLESGAMTAWSSMRPRRFSSWRWPTRRASGYVTISNYGNPERAMVFFDQ